MFRDHSHRHKVPDFIAIPMFKSEIYKELRNEWKDFAWLTFFAHVDIID